MLERINKVIFLISFITLIISCNYSNKQSEISYLDLLKHKKWYFVDSPTGKVLHPNEYYTFDEKYQYMYIDGVLESKDEFYFSDTCVFNTNQKVKSRGKLQVFEDYCNEIENLSDSIYSFWDGKRGISVLEVK